MKMREEVTEDQLLNILNAELYKHAELKKCRFISIQRSEPDSTGCNWSAQVRSSGVPHYISAPIAGKISAEARTKYNLKNENRGVRPGD